MSLADHADYGPWFDRPGIAIMFSEAVSTMSESPSGIAYVAYHSY